MQQHASDTTGSHTTGSQATASQAIAPEAAGILFAIEEQAIAIADEAAELLLEGFGKRIPTSEKGSSSDLVTEYDLRSEALLRKRLGTAFADDVIVGEEEGGEPTGERIWYLDPIDGTSNFAHGHPFFCISMGLWIDGEPAVGVVRAPAMGLTFSAHRGGGLRRNGEPVRVSTTSSLGDSLLATGFPPDRASSKTNNYRPFVELDARTHGVRRCAAAALELSLVAQGAYDGFWDVGLAPWDVAAAILFVQEAGGRVSDFAGCRPSLHGGQIVASNGNIHDALLAELSHASHLKSQVEVARS